MQLCFLPNQLPQNLDFAGAFAAEIEDWTAEEWVYGGLRGAA